MLHQHLLGPSYLKLLLQGQRTSNKVMPAMNVCYREKNGTTTRVYGHSGSLWHGLGPEVKLTPGLL